MQLSAMLKGLAVGAAAGTVGYLLTASSDREKSRLKRKTIRAARAIGAVMDTVADMMH